GKDLVERRIANIAADAGGDGHADLPGKRERRIDFSTEGPRNQLRDSWAIDSALCTEYSVPGTPATPDASNAKIQRSHRHFFSGAVTVIVTGRLGVETSVFGFCAAFGSLLYGTCA